MARVFSGLQPSGEVHIGNYLGAIRSWVELQNEHECYYCIVDYHAITVPYEPTEMQGRILDTVASYLACGLDPKKAIIFVQSHVPEHTELSWLFTTMTPLGWLERMTQYKDKSERQGGSVSAGLLMYPVLQAADILMYKGELVPVGEDQVQHIELTRDIARRFNHLFGETFPEPEAYVTATKRIMALNDPQQKMSKSIPGSYIALSDSPEEIMNKVRRAVTDAGPADGEMSPGVRNLFTLLEAFSPPETVKEFEQAYEEGRLRYVDLKKTLAADMAAYLEPIRQKRQGLLSHKDDLYDILNDGAAKARQVAREVIDEVKRKMGVKSSYLRI